MKYENHVSIPLAEGNFFKTLERETTPPPAFAEVRGFLPRPFWDSHPTAIDCYWKTWELAFRNTFAPAPESGFVANFIDTAFNGCLFMWDSAFILMFGRYGKRAFDFQRTLDNFYACQHPDGFISREIQESDGEERFERFDPSSTGPNVMQWTEWEYYLNFGDKERLARVFPILAAYHQWTRSYRTWQDGTYWSTGWGTGMDNQPRLPKQLMTDSGAIEWYHARMSWIDVCLQQILSCRILIEMADAIGRRHDAQNFADELESLTRVVNATMWDEKTAFYYDRFADGSLNGVKSIGAFWALLADTVPEGKFTRFIDHLRNPAEFNRPHRVPSLSADTPEYNPTGAYWRGSVWPNTNYMILRGLTHAGEDDLAREIGMNHHEQVVRVYEETGTLWENYAPESAAPGKPSKADLVGWGGLGPIAVFFEYVLGLRPNVPDNRLVWDVRLLEAHGVEQYPFGPEGLLNLRCPARASADEEPRIQATANCPLKIEIRWNNGRKVINL